MTIVDCCRIFEASLRPAIASEKIIGCKRRLAHDLRNDFIGKQSRFELASEVSGIAVNIGFGFFQAKQRGLCFQLTSLVLCDLDFALNALLSQHSRERSAQFVHFFGDYDKPEVGRVFKARGRC